MSSLMDWRHLSSLLELIRFHSISHIVVGQDSFSIQAIGTHSLTMARCDICRGRFQVIGVMSSGVTTCLSCWREDVENNMRADDDPVEEFGVCVFSCV